MPRKKSGGTVGGTAIAEQKTDKKLTRRQEKFVKELVANDGLVTMREAAIGLALVLVQHIPVLMR